MKHVQLPFFLASAVQYMIHIQKDLPFLLPTRVIAPYERTDIWDPEISNKINSYTNKIVDNHHFHQSRQNMANVTQWLRKWFSSGTNNKTSRKKKNLGYKLMALSRTHWPSHQFTMMTPTVESKWYGLLHIIPFSTKPHG